MKLLNKLLVLFCLSSIMLTSCEKDEVRTIAGEGQSGSLKSTATAINLTKETLNSKVVEFTHTESDFGYNAGITYSLQFGLKGSNFTPAREVVFANGVTSRSYTGLELNNLLSAMNLPFDANSDVEVRLKSSISPNIAVYSNVVNINTKPIPLTSWIYLPGDYQGWDPGTADSLISLTGNGIYTGVINFPEGKFGFKITPAKNWNVNYGDGGSGTISPTGGNFQAPAAGTMLLTMDMNSNTWTIEPTAIWGMIGDAVPNSNWSVDADMKFVNDGKGNWVLKTNLNTGEFKFRKNHDWGTNLGGSNGTLSLGGANIKVTEAGSYTITMNPTDLTFTIVKN